MDFSQLSNLGLLLAVLFVALLESLAVIGLLVPGIAMLLALTLVAVDAGVPAWGWFLAGSVGAFAGDGVSFWLGQKAGPGVRHWAYFRRHPRVLAEGETFFLRYGVWSIMLGRFIGPLRPVVPLAAGALAMPAARFWLANALSSPAWGGVYLLGMYWLGEEFSQYLQPGPALMFLAGATLVAVAVSLVLRGRQSS